MNKKFKISILVFAGILLLVLVIIPCFIGVLRVNGMMYVCRYCGVHLVYNTTRFYGFNIGSIENLIQDSLDRQKYSELIGKEHEHVWAYYDRTDEIIEFFGEEGIPDNRGDQFRLTKDALDVAEALKQEPIEIRQKIYFKLVDIISSPICKNSLEVRTIIREVPESTNNDTARGFWEKWILENEKP
jgi:hypothetical protein